MNKKQEIPAEKFFFTYTYLYMKQIINSETDHYNTWYKKIIWWA